MRRPVPVALALAAVLFPATSLALPAELDYVVPSVNDPTLQAAVNDAAANPAALSVIFLAQSPIHVSAAVTIAAPFTASQRLLIRPATTLARATVIGDDPNADVFLFTGGGQGGGATLQDLDILREITNNHHLVEDSYAFTDLLIQRCRIGSTDSSPSGSGGWSMIELSNPVNVTVKNCILFSVSPGTFDRGIHVSGFPDDVGNLRLYNNTVTDYGLYGIHLEDDAVFAVTFDLRNNVAANAPSIPAGSEPYAFRSDVSSPAATVITSGNASFASATHGSWLGVGAQSITGTDLDMLSPSVLGSTTDPTTAFQQRLWDATQGYDANPAFFRLWVTGALHDGPEDVGTNVLDGTPNAFDQAVTDDVYGDPRPSGVAPGHTDRGAHQVDPVGVAVPPLAGSPGLEAAPLATPEAAPALRWRAGRAGRLEVELFDLAGRRVRGETRAVGAGEQGTARWPGAANGVYLYRATLRDAAGRIETARGRLVVLR